MSVSKLSIRKESPVSQNEGTDDQSGKMKRGPSGTACIAAAALAISFFSLSSQPSANPALPANAVPDPCASLSNCPTLEQGMDIVKNSTQKLSLIPQLERDFAVFENNSKLTLAAQSEMIASQGKNLLAALSHLEGACNHSLDAAKRQDEILMIANQGKNLLAAVSHLEGACNHSLDAGKRQDEMIMILSKQVESQKILLQNQNVLLNAFNKTLESNNCNELAGRLDGLAQDIQDSANFRSSSEVSASFITTALSSSAQVIIQLLSVLSQANAFCWIILLPHLYNTRIGRFVFAPLIPTLASMQSIAETVKIWMQSQIKQVPVPVVPDFMSPFRMPNHWEPRAPQTTLLAYLPNS